MTISLRNVAIVLFALLFAFGTAMAMPTNTFAQTDEDESSEDSDRLAELRETVQALLAKVQALQVKIQEMRGEVQELRSQIREEIRIGMQGEDIRSIQEILASDPSLYPEGLVTGYFGPLTSQAIRRFQQRFDLDVSGEMDEETREAFETLLEERFGEGQIPPGLLNAPGIMKKFERRLELGCDNSGPGKAPFCAKIKEKYEFSDDDEEEDEDEDEDENDNEADANEAISDAAAVIAALQAAVDDEDDGEDKDSAQDSLDDANAKLDSAEQARNDENYDEAEDLADEAEDIAEEAYEELTGEEYEEEEEEEEEEDDDDDDDDEEDDD